MPLPVYKVFYLAYVGIIGNMGVTTFFCDQAGLANGTVTVPLSVTYTDTASSVMAQVSSAVDAYSMSNYGFTPTSGEWLFNPIGATSKSFSSPTRSLNTAFQPSTTLDTVGLYSVSIASSLSLTAGQLGSIVLEYADDSSITVNVKTCATVSNGNTGLLSLGVSTLQTSGSVVSCVIPKSKYARLRVVNTTGSPTTSSIVTQEVQF